MKSTKEPAWVEFGPKLLEFDEVSKLAAALDIPEAQAAAHIALLVAYARDFSDDTGRIDHMRPVYIARACYWDGPPEALLTGFIAADVVSGTPDSFADPLRISVHVWDELAGRFVAARIAARERKRNERANKKTGKKKN